MKSFSVSEERCRNHLDIWINMWKRDGESDLAKPVVDLRSGSVSPKNRNIQQLFPFFSFGAWNRWNPKRLHFTNTFLGRSKNNAIEQVVKTRLIKLNKNGFVFIAFLVFSILLLVAFCVLQIVFVKTAKLMVCFQKIAIENALLCNRQKFQL